MSSTERSEDFMRAEVRAVEQLTPNMLRVHFAGDQLQRFTATEHPDQRVWIAFPVPGHAQPPTPQLVEGCGRYPDAVRAEVRNYTVRAWHPAACELVVDFALHAHGLASDWARASAPGTVVYLHADVGWYRPPADTRWWLLSADMAGLPALGHIVEHLPPNAYCHAIVEVSTAADLQQWDSPATEFSVQYLIGSGNETAANQLAAAVRAFPPPKGPGYVWSATEAGIARAIRKHVRGSWGMDASRFDITGYWRADQEAWLVRYRQVQTQIEAVWQTALAEGKSDDEAEELYEHALEQAGL
jgi:NADPH-dependent ferric siderophore reductase